MDTVRQLHLYKVQNRNVPIISQRERKAETWQLFLCVHNSTRPLIFKLRQCNQGKVQHKEKDQRLTQLLLIYQKISTMLFYHWKNLLEATAQSGLLRSHQLAAPHIHIH